MGDQPRVLNNLGEQMQASETVTVQPKPHITLLPPKSANRWFVTHAPATPDKVAPVSAAIGAVIGMGIILCFTYPLLGIYMIAMGTFHLLEFMVTAQCNKDKVNMSSFLLTNGIGYILAHVVACSELFYRFAYKNEHNKVVSAIALTFVLGGQIVRTLAMIQAAESFNHFVQVNKRPEHQLVKTGVYGIIRHPSYFGYYFWAIGTQLLVRNWLTFSVFAVALVIYFRQRVGPEEAALVRFFGQDYRNYRKNVWSGIFFYP